MGTLANSAAQTRLLRTWEARLKELAKHARKPELATLKITGRKEDGSIIFRAAPGWEIGRTHKGTFIPGPGRSFTYRLHKDGRLCGHGYKDCGCGHGAQETATAQAAWAAGGKTAYAQRLKPAQRTARGIALKPAGKPAAAGKARGKGKPATASRKPATAPQPAPTTAPLAPAAEAAA